MAIVKFSAPSPDKGEDKNEAVLNAAFGGAYLMGKSTKNVPLAVASGFLSAIIAEQSPGAGKLIAMVAQADLGGYDNRRDKHNSQ